MPTPTPAEQVKQARKVLLRMYHADKIAIWPPDVYLERLNAIIDALTTTRTQAGREAVERIMSRHSQGNATSDAAKAYDIVLEAAVRDVRTHFALPSERKEKE